MGVIPGRRTAALVLVVAVVLGVAAAGCSSDGDGASDDDLSPGTTAEFAAPTVPEPPAPPEPGTGVLTIGSSTFTFDVDGCALSPDPAEPEAARALATFSGSGETTRGVPFTIEGQRFATTLDEVTTYTDTVAYTDSARILQAQRIEVGGQVTDLRDPDAAQPLIRTTGATLTAAGLAGAPGDGAGAEGIVGLALAVTCQ